MNMVILENTTKQFRAHKNTITALDDICLTVKEGEFVVIYGPSGSGKTTLLMTAAGMQRPDRGTVKINRTDIYALSVGARAHFRAQTIGFVFQMFHLVPYLNVIDNVLLAGRGKSNSEGLVEANELLKQLAMSERSFHKPAELSAGEKQRVALARALFNQPSIIMADEPTGNLDADNAAIVLRTLSDFNKKGGTVILVTHGTGAEPFANRVIHLQNGSVKSVL